MLHIPTYYLHMCKNKIIHGFYTRQGYAVFVKVIRAKFRRNVDEKSPAQFMCTYNSWYTLSRVS